jgi:hypothetical protein
LTLKIQELTEKLGLVERKGNALQGELEEARALLDSADRGKKQTDMELAEARCQSHQNLRSSFLS